MDTEFVDPADPGARVVLLRQWTELKRVKRSQVPPWTERMAEKIIDAAMAAVESLGDWNVKGYVACGTWQGTSESDAIEILTVSSTIRMRVVRYHSVRDPKSCRPIQVLRKVNEFAEDLTWDGELDNTQRYRVTMVLRVKGSGAEEGRKRMLNLFPPILHDVQETVG